MATRHIPGLPRTNGPAACGVSQDECVSKSVFPRSRGRIHRCQAGPLACRRPVRAGRRHCSPEKAAVHQHGAAAYFRPRCLRRCHSGLTSRHQRADVAESAPMAPAPLAVPPQTAAPHIPRLAAAPSRVTRPNGRPGRRLRISWASFRPAADSSAVSLTVGRPGR